MEDTDTKNHWDAASAMGQNQASESQLNRGASESKVSLAHGVKFSRARTHEPSVGEAGGHAGATGSWMLRSSSAATTNLPPL